jgi:membrane-associated phospholipid phosphatase
MTAPPTDRPRRREVLGWTIALSLLWVLLYSGCNWITSLRADVRVLRFGWEKSIPLVPWLIVPYMSIDAFFVAAPFLCTTRAELHSLLRRLFASTLIASLIFLMVPMTLAGERPSFEGWAGAIHNFLKAGDKPYNLFPSMHAAFALLLWPVYHRHTRGVLRVAAHGWFALMLLSILPVYQHHFVDLVGGVVLALICMLAFPERREAPVPVTQSVRAPRIAARFALAAAPFLALAVWLGPWGAGAAWIGIALVAVASAYALGDADLFHKREGRIPVGTRFFLAPYLLGLGASRRYYFRRTGLPWMRVGNGLIVGRQLRGPDAARLIQQERVVAVIDLTAEHNEAPPLLNLPYLNLPVLDLTTPTEAHCRAAAEFAAQHAPLGTVYIHCGLGLSRSATIAAACLLATGEAESVDAACATVTRARPHARISRDAKLTLEAFAPAAVRARAHEPSATELQPSSPARR